MEVTNVALQRAAVVRHTFLKIKCHKPPWLHEGHRISHLLYFAAIAISEHGFLSVVGGILLAFGIASFIWEDGISEEEE